MTLDRPTSHEVPLHEISPWTGLQEAFEHAYGCEAYTIDPNDPTKKHTKLQLDIPVCYGCHSSNAIIEDRKEGTLVCTDCGFVLKDHEIDPGQEWRTFSNDNENDGVNMTRTGDADGNLLGDQLMTTIATGGDLASKQLARIQASSSMFTNNDKDNKKLKEALRTMRQYVQRLNLQAAVNQVAGKLLRQIFQQKEHKGNFKDEEIAAVIYLATKHVPNLGAPIGLGEIVESCGVDRKKFRLSLKNLQRVMSTLDLDKAAIKIYESKALAEKGEALKQEKKYRNTVLSQQMEESQRQCSIRTEDPPSDTARDPTLDVTQVPHDDLVSNSPPPAYVVPSARNRHKKVAAPATECNKAAKEKTVEEARAAMQEELFRKSRNNYNTSIASPASSPTLFLSPSPLPPTSPLPHASPISDATTPPPPPPVAIPVAIPAQTSTQPTVQPAPSIEEEKIITTTGRAKELLDHWFDAKLDGQFEYWIKGICDGILDCAEDTYCWASLRHTTMAAATLWIAMALTGKKLDFEPLAKLAGCAVSTMKNNYIGRANDEKEKMLNSKFWPKDPRCKKENWVDFPTSNGRGAGKGGRQKAGNKRSLEPEIGEGPDPKRSKP